MGRSQIVHPIPYFCPGYGTEKDNFTYTKVESNHICFLRFQKLGSLEARLALQCLSYVEMVPQQSIVTGFIPLQDKSITTVFIH